MALQPKIIACGNSVASFAMAVRFLTGPAVMVVASIAVGLRGRLLHIAIVQALVDAPDMERTQMNFKMLSLTDIKIDIKRVPKKKELLDAMEKADVKKKWESSSWGRKLIVQKRRQNLIDFDRFELMLAKIKRAGLVRQELAKLKKENVA